MKKFFSAVTATTFCLVIIFSLQGCFKDSCTNTYTIFTPVYKKLSEARSEMKSGAPQPLMNTGKIYMYGNYIFLNEIRKGIHVIDNSNPALPKNIGFINIPGNIDLAVKGNYLYADCYSDIVVFNISNPTNVVVNKFMNNVVPEYGYFWGNSTNIDSVSIIVDYISKDTTVDCQTYDMWKSCGNCMRFDNFGGVFLTAAAAPQQGAGGSMARLSIVNNYMYGVSSYKLYAFNIADGANPQLTNSKVIGGGIETIYPFKEKLFIGSTSGMFIYDITNPANPVSQGQFRHASSCDPVISDGQNAYVTLRSGTACTGYTNQLDVVNVSNISSPSLLKTYAMTNPHGLSKDGDKLFICDGKDGLKIYNAANPNDIQLIKKIGNMQTFDVIAMNGIALVVAKDGLYQYNYENVSNIYLMSKINIARP